MEFLSGLEITLCKKNAIRVVICNFSKMGLFIPSHEISYAAQIIVLFFNIFGNTLDCRVVSYLIGTLASSTSLGTLFGHFWIVISIYPLHSTYRQMEKERLLIDFRFIIFIVIFFKQIVGFQFEYYPI